MKCAAVVLAVLVVTGCSIAANTPALREAGAPAPIATAPIADDGSFLAGIDPLGGRWKFHQVGGADFTGFNSWIGFSEGGFLDHGVGCGGGFPAFYRLDRDRITITRLDAVRASKFAETPELVNGTAAFRKIAADSAPPCSFIDQLSGWVRTGDTLVLTARDGTRAVFPSPASRSRSSRDDGRSRSSAVFSW